MEFNQELLYYRIRNEIYSGVPELPHDHSYLRFLRGEFKDVDSSIERLTIQNGDQETQAESDHLSEIENMLQGLLKHWFQDWSTRMEHETLRFPLDQRKENALDPRVTITCTRCSEQIDPTGVYFFCTVCKVDVDRYPDLDIIDRTFDLCENCVLSGKRCGSLDHEPRLVRSTLSGFLRVPAKAIHSIPRNPKDGLLPAIDTLNMPDTNLRAVIEAYISQGVKQLNTHCRSGQLENFRIHRFEGESKESWPDTVCEATICIFEWRQICHFLMHDHYEPPIHRFLTPEHMDVIKLLLEWWMGDIQDSRLSQMALNGLLIENLFPATRPSDIASLKGSTRSEYQQALVKLFQLEFNRDPLDPSVLRLHRAEASRHASVQRLGFSYLRGNMFPLWHQPAEHMYETARKHLVSISRFMCLILTVCEKANARETHRFAVEVLTAYHDSMDLAMVNLCRAQILLGPKQLNASISSCGWIPQAEKLTNVPYYLWDKKGRRTVCTKTFRYLPEYTVVSHTWGRWRIKGSEDIELPGVPWKIPQNHRFSVQNLADILDGVPGCNRYVWFDLVCIPQSTNDAHLRAIEKKEIAIQAAIFSHAETAVAWFNTIDKFGPLEDICHMLAMNVLRYPGQFDEIQLNECLDRLSRLNKELMNEPLLIPLARIGLKTTYPDDMAWDKVLDEWFSSLWTLQEACMRPDMWLCTRSWKPLKSHASGTPIPLDCVLSLIRANATNFLEVLGSKRPIPHQWSSPTDQEISSKEALRGLVFNDHETHEGAKLIKSPPPCLYNLVLYASTAGLIDIPGIEPIRIITMGNQRECSERNRRAEAVMAVLGATVWSQDPNSDRQLVLERFPMAFVIEVRRKLGDFKFFSSDIARDFWSSLNENSICMTQIEKLKVKGTLLPFSEERSRDVLRLSLKNIPLPLKTQEPHPEITHWHIEANGNVTVPKASVLMSSLNSSDSELKDANFYVVDLHDIFRMREGLSPSPQHFVNMKKWMSTRRYTCYAVALHRAESVGGLYYSFSGVIFRELKPGVLIKSGRFDTNQLQPKDYGWSNPDEVNWTVL